MPCVSEDERSDGMTPSRGVDSAAASDGAVSADDWRPETLAKQAAAGAAGQIELVHTCCDSSRFVAASIPLPALPARADHRFNRDQKRTIAALLSGDAELCDRPHTRRDRTVASHLGKLSKNRVSDYLGRADENATAILQSFGCAGLHAIRAV